MNKAILLTEMPKDGDGCIDCRFYENDFYGSCYVMDERPIDDIGERPGWCPLIPIPKLDNSDMYNGDRVHDSYAKGLADGVNGFFEKLEGRANDETQGNVDRD